MGLHDMVEDFVVRWCPKQEALDEFVRELRALLEAYGRATLMHQSFPDTEHEHGDPV